MEFLSRSFHNLGDAGMKTSDPRESWQGQSLMAIGMQDPVLGPVVMGALHRSIRNCPPPMEMPRAGHFVQEWGEPIAKAALDRFQF